MTKKDDPPPLEQLLSPFRDGEVLGKRSADTIDSSARTLAQICSQKKLRLDCEVSRHKSLTGQQNQSAEIPAGEEEDKAVPPWAIPVWSLDKIPFGVGLDISKLPAVPDLNATEHLRWISSMELHNAKVGRPNFWKPRRATI